jgi:hypothetical protein
MFSNLSSLGRVGVVSLAALSSLPVAAPAAPLGPIINPAVVAQGGAITPIPVEMGEGRGGTYRFWPRNGGHWNGGGHWHGGGWNGRHWHHGGWGHRGWGGWGSGLALGLGLGIPLGYYGGGYYNSYDSYYDNPGYYAVPVYRPRLHRNRAYYRSHQHSLSNSVGEHCDNVYQTGPAFSGCQSR